MNQLIGVNLQPYIMSYHHMLENPKLISKSNSSSSSSSVVVDQNIRYIDAMGTYHYTRNSSGAREVDITFDAMKMNNYSDSLCSAEKYSSDLHVKNMGLMFTLVESYKLPYWHNRGLARIASRYGSGLVEVKRGNIINPDHDFDLMLLVKNETHWLTTINHMVEHCPEQLFCVVQVQWNIPRLYIWKIGLPVKYANLMPVYHRNITHGQYHPFHNNKVGVWTRLDDIFPLKKAKLWMYELPVAKESWSDCEDGLNTTRIFAKHTLVTKEEQQQARQLMYGCAQNLSNAGFASYFNCFDKEGFFNGYSWKERVQ